MLVAIAGVANAWLLQPVLDEIFLNKNETLLFYIPFALVAIAFISGLANYVQTMQMRYVGQHIVAEMQTELFHHLMHADLGLFHQQASGRLVSRFTNDIQMMRQATSSVLAGLAKELISLVFLVALMCYQSWQLASLALIAFPIAIYPILRLGKRMRKVADGTQRELGEFTFALDETFSNVRVVKAYGQEEQETAKAKEGIFRLLRLYMKASKVQAAASPLMEVVAASGIAMVIGYGGYQVIHGHHTPGEFFSFIAAMLMAYRPLRTLAGLNTQLQEGFAAASRFFAALDMPATIQDSDDARILQVTEGDIAMQQVGFHYHDGTPVLQDISLHIPARKMVALVGASGSGKTTLMNLLLRFYDAQEGSITIDGQNIHDVTLQSLHSVMAFVSQEIMLFDDSVAANIAYSRPDASLEDIIEAAKAAAAHEFIEQLPHGYNTRIGAAGVLLSGGQKQRLCIARAFLRNAPILLLDEATSALDSHSEQLVQHALQKLMEARTTLVIAHRLSTILHADSIYVLDAGRVVEHGTHADLLAKGGHYANLYYTQFSNLPPQEIKAHVQPPSNNTAPYDGLDFTPIHA